MMYAFVWGRMAIRPHYIHPIKTITRRDETTIRPDNPTMRSRKTTPIIHPHRRMAMMCAVIWGCMEMMYTFMWGRMAIRPYIHPIKTIIRPDNPTIHPYPN